MNAKKLIPYLHGIIFSATASLALYVTMQDASIFSPPNAIWRPTIFTLVLYIIFAVILYKILKNHETSGLVATIIMLGLVYLWTTFLVVLISAIFTWLLLAVVGKKFTMTQLHASLITIGVACSAYFYINYITFIANNSWDEKANLTPRLEFQPTRSEQSKPDIYYIILDGYGGAEMLQNLHGFDNFEFISELEKRGFIVPQDSRSNYPRTILSLSSSLNMQYIDNINSKMGDSFLWWPLMGTLKNNQVRSNLESIGYKTVNTATGWDFTTLEDADYYQKSYPVFLNKFEEMYFQTTNLSLLSFLNKIGISIPSYDTHRNTILFQFEALKRSPELPSPKFVFAHLITPHAPFIFDENGTHLTPDYPFTFSDDRYFLSPPSKYRSGYISQLLFINKMVLQTIDNILLNSKTPPIIIIQGDHGPGVFIDYHSAENSCLYERFSILNAYYLPGFSQNIPDDITPVNTFRMIFNEYFRTDIELLPNRHYFSPSFMMYQFEDVGDSINSSCEMQ